MPRKEFQPLQAQEIARAFRQQRVDYLFIGKSGAILLGYPAVTQDVDLFLPKATYHDVTRPVYTRSVGRWRAYEKYLAPILPALEPYCRRFGYG